MKSCLTIAATATLASAGFSNEFIKGMQTGAFITAARQLDDYNCPEPEIDPKAEKGLNMLNMAKNFMPKGGKAQKEEVDTSAKKTFGSSSKTAQKEPDMFDKIDDYADQLVTIYSVMSRQYEGGDFCQGIIVGYEGRSVGQDVLMSVIKGRM